MRPGRWVPLGVDKKAKTNEHNCFKIDYLAANNQKKLIV